MPKTKERPRAIRTLRGAVYTPRGGVFLNSQTAQPGASRGRRGIQFHGRASGRTRRLATRLAGERRTQEADHRQVGPQGREASPSIPRVSGGLLSQALPLQERHGGLSYVRGTRRRGGELGHRPHLCDGLQGHAEHPPFGPGLAPTRGSAKRSAYLWPRPRRADRSRSYPARKAPTGSRCAWRPAAQPAGIEIALVGRRGEIFDVPVDKARS